jgi:hypothetical protein
VYFSVRERENKNFKYAFKVRTHVRFLWYNYLADIENGGCSRGNKATT